jgi:hypothetical protein
MHTDLFQGRGLLMLALLSHTSPMVRILVFALFLFIFIVVIASLFWYTRAPAAGTSIKGEGKRSRHVD